MPYAIITTFVLWARISILSFRIVAILGEVWMNGVMSGVMLRREFIMEESRVGEAVLWGSANG